MAFTIVFSSLALLLLLLTAQLVATVMLLRAIRRNGSGSVRRFADVPIHVNIDSGDRVADSKTNLGSSS